MRFLGYVQAKTYICSFLMIFMGLQISDIVTKKSIELNELKGKTLCVDAFNIIYQFLTTIRQPDGTPLMDKKRRVTSHLSGLFYRNMALLNEGIKLIYVFDGKAPKLKKATHEKRKQAKDIVKEKYEKAVKEEDVESMGKYSRSLVSLDEDKIKESKELLKAMGIAVIQAPEEGEAMASYICKKEKDVFAVASQDYDSLVFEAPRLLQNLTLAKKRKTISGYVEVKPQIIELKNVLKELGINQQQLICIGILAGTDYNPKGIHGIGQKKALKIVKEHKTPEKIFEAENVKEKLDFDWKQVYDLIENPKVDKDYKIDFPKFDEDKIKEILMNHDFSENRIESQFEKLKERKDKQKQSTLF